MEPPAPTVVSPVTALVIRVLTFVCLVISLIILTTSTATLSVNIGGMTYSKLQFNDFYAYWYTLATIVIGIAYTLLQTAFTIFQLHNGQRLGGDGLRHFDFYGDKVASYMLATGAAAGFGAAKFTSYMLATGATAGAAAGAGVAVDNFFNKERAAAILLLLGFVFSAVSSIFSSLSLPKRSY